MAKSNRSITSAVKTEGRKQRGPQQSAHTPDHPAQAPRDRSRLRRDTDARTVGGAPSAPVDVRNDEELATDAARGEAGRGEAGRDENTVEIPEVEECVGDGDLEAEDATLDAAAAQVAGSALLAACEETSTIGAIETAVSKETTAAETLRATVLSVIDPSWHTPAARELLARLDAEQCTTLLAWLAATWTNGHTSGVTELTDYLKKAGQ